QMDALRNKVRQDVMLRLKRRAEGELRSSLASVQSQIDNLQEQIKQLRPDVQNLRAEMDKIGERHAELDLAKSSLEPQQALLRTMRQQKERESVELQNTKQRIHCVQIDVPPNPDHKTQAIIIAVAGVLGLLLGVTAVSFQQYLGGRIHSSAEVAKDLGLH